MHTQQAYIWSQRPPSSHCTIVQSSEARRHWSTVSRCLYHHSPTRSRLWLPINVLLTHVQSISGDTPTRTNEHSQATSHKPQKKRAQKKKKKKSRRACRGTCMVHDHTDHILVPDTPCQKQLHYASYSTVVQRINRKTNNTGSSTDSVSFSRAQKASYHRVSFSDNIEEIFRIEYVLANF